jgi:hypothetical protein
LLSGSPSNISGPLRAHYQSTRSQTLSRAGVIGVIAIQNPIGQDVPWERGKLARFRPMVSLADSKLEETHGLQLAVTFNPAKAEKLFNGSGHTFAEIMKLAEAGKALPRFPIPASVRATVAFERKSLESQNVIGILPGTDPRLRNEYVVLSAHLDHVGKGEPINNDPIYNGAMDNASGIATLIEAATTFSKTNKRFRRSVIFLAVTAEEHGLKGSKYYAAYPTVPAANLVANINIDMRCSLRDHAAYLVDGLGCLRAAVGHGLARPGIGGEIANVGLDHFLDKGLPPREILGDGVDILAIGGDPVFRARHLGLTVEQRQRVMAVQQRGDRHTGHGYHPREQKCGDDCSGRHLQS